MKLFESSFIKDFEYYERVFDTELNRSVIRKITVPFEWFEPSDRGQYISITDSTKRFERKQGNSKQARGKDGVFNPIERTIRDNYWGNNYNKNPRVFHLDIETRTGTNSKGFPKPELALEPVCLIQVHDSHSNTIFVFGDRNWTFEKNYSEKIKELGVNVKFFNCETEEQIFNGYFKLFKQLDPLIIYAWNGDGFDYPYLYNRAQNLGLDTGLFSNHGSVKLKKVKSGYRETHSLVADGHVYFDLLQVYKKFTFGQKASYSLENIASEELGENKVQHTEYEKFDDFYSGVYRVPENPTEEQKNSNVYKAAMAFKETGDDKYLKLVQELSYSEFVYYGVKDPYLTLKIDQKKNFTALMVNLAEKMGVKLEDTLGTVKQWSQYIANKAYQNKEIIEARESSDETVSVKGGRVTEPIVGLHEWVCSVDVNSMYPNLGMRAFNMSPEKFVPKHKLPPDLREYILRYFNDEDEDARMTLPEDVWDKVSELLKQNEMCLGINGAVFKTDSIGMIPEIIKTIYSERKEAKKTQFEYEKKKLLIKDILKAL